MEHAWSRDHATSLVTTVYCHHRANVWNSLPEQLRQLDITFGQFRRSRKNILCLVSWAVAPCVWTLRAPTRNLLTYLPLFLLVLSDSKPCVACLVHWSVIGEGTGILRLRHQHCCWQWLSPSSVSSSWHDMHTHNIFDDKSFTVVLLSHPNNAMKRETN